MTRRTPRLALVAPLALAALAALAGACSPKRMLVPNLPPETTVFVQGPVTAVNHIVHLYWFGSDPDGDVIRYEYRFLDTLTTGQPLDTLRAKVGWTRTSRTDLVFTLFTDQHDTIPPVFEVRAVDNKELADPTPAVEAFKFTNEPPRLVFTNAPLATDQTFYSLTLRWTPFDKDGDTGKMTYRVWLNGSAAHDTILPAGSTEYTIPSAYFLLGDSLGAPTDTIVPRTVYVQPIDDGGRAGALAIASWRVRKPARVLEPDGRGRLLIIDDLPNSEPGAAGLFGTDAFYANGVRTHLQANGTYSTLRLEVSQPFRSAKDVEQTCKLFKAVLWYRGSQTTRFTTSKTPAGDVRLLGPYESALGAYVDGGGKLMLEGTELIGQGVAQGALSSQFLSDYLGSDYLYQRFLNAQDSSASWSTVAGTIATTLSTPVTGDSLKFTFLVVGLRAFALRSSGDGLFWAAPGTLSENNPISMPVAVSVPQHLGQPNEGRVVAVTFPMNRADGLGAAARAFKNILQNHLGVSP